MENLSDKELPLFFSADYDTNEFHIIEAPEELYSQILDNQVYVKPNMCAKDPKKSTAAFVSQNGSFQVQKFGKSMLFTI